MCARRVASRRVAARARSPLYLQNKLLYNVFQEYARSGLLDRVFLIDNCKLSDILGPVPIMKFWDSINNLLVTTYHMLNVFQNTQPIMTTQTKRINTARVSTFGLLNSEKNKENMFFKMINEFLIVASKFSL